MGTLEFLSAYTKIILNRAEIARHSYLPEREYMQVLAELATRTSNPDSLIFCDTASILYIGET